MNKLLVGQDLFYVPNARYGEPSIETVLSVGRKWAEISNGKRIHIESMRADGGDYTSPGTCYLSREAYEAEQALTKAWQELKTMFDHAWTVPAGVTLSQIENAKRSLFKASS